MEIKGRDRSIAIIMLMMEGEYNATKITMASLLNSIGGEKDVSISLLLNGSKNKKIEEYFKKIPNLKFYSSTENLGVIGGRNFLFSKPEVIGSDIILVLDNDLFLPTDYVKNICEFLVSHPDAGIVHPVMLWAKKFTDLFDIDPEKMADDEIPPDVPKLRSSEIKNSWMETGDAESLYYLGTHSWYLTDCLATPTSIQNLLIWLEKKGLIKSAPHLLMDTDPKVASLIRGGAVELKTQNANGGGQVFFSSLLSEVGFYEPGYNPYGHADHEFSIRVLKAGYTNYASLDTFVLHGIDKRHKERSHERRKYIYARRRVITTRKVSMSPLIKIFTIAEIFVHTMVTSILHNIIRGRLTFPSVRQGLAGWWFGITAKLTENEKLVDEARRARERVLKK